MTIEKKYVIVRNADNEIIYYDFLESGEISTSNRIEIYDTLTDDLQKEVDEFLKSNNNLNIK